jgi:hypothetical protein
VQRDFRSREHHQQLGLVGMEAFEQLVEGDEPGLEREDAIEPRLQGRLAAFAGGEPVGFEIAVKPPDQPTDLALGNAKTLGMHLMLCTR